MKSMLKLSLFLFTLSILSSCSDDETPSVATACVLEEVDSFKATQINGNNASVKAYTFRETTVFAFQQGQCVSDGGTRVMTGECNEFCFLGGIGGIVDCQGENFEDNAVFIETLWEN